MQRRGMVAHYAERPAELLVTTFLLTIAVGTLLLSIPLAVRGEGSASFVDALFTSTSAVCVTGLIVKDTPVYFSKFGLAVILGLIQIGGLGIMTISSAVALAIRRGMAVRYRVVMQQVMDQTYYEELQQVLKRIVWGTFLIEGIGALLLAWAWYEPQLGLMSTLWHSVFHSVSAFCNAGFALFSNSLVGFQGSPFVLIVHMALIVLGGIGFTVIGPILSFRLPRSTHARLTVIVTLILLVAGLVFFFFVESNRGMIDQPMSARFWNALFQSVTARTAGFNTVDLTTWSNASIVVLLILMFVGASPGSTGGGIKTTTLGVLVLSVISMMRGRSDVEFHGRRLPQEIIIKSIAIMLLSLALVYTFTVALMLTESASFKDVMFEVTSAFGTVGLSLGLTPKLSVAGKVLITILMFLGRVGPLTAAMIVGERMVKAAYRYPVERVMVG
jgi:trk system potassium uptake protein TrkH